MEILFGKPAPSVIKTWEPQPLVTVKPTGLLVLTCDFCKGEYLAEHGLYERNCGSSQCINDSITKEKQRVWAEDARMADYYDDFEDDNDE